ncbi:M23 family metallopeptidase [Polaromonas glacialis]|uniref:M23 family metallopeptidase n=1 Tax=Polaromonas glacialis TaxID=866564 RepID=UPI000496E9BB|nr:M23 family metallopeptidase [Polaromonas glacialis]
MTELFMAQLALPLALIGWVALVPPRNLTGFCIQVIASAAALGAMALLGIWLLPPWWAPLAFGVALAAAAWAGLRRRWPFAAALPATAGAWRMAGLFAVVGAASLYGIGIALGSRIAPPVEAVSLAFPLERGVYLVVNGGSSLHTNAHLLTLDASSPRFGQWRGQSYGVDIVKLDGLGLRARGVQPPEPKAYRIYGARVLAPCAGRVVLAVDGLRDMPVPQVDRDHLAGNHVMLRCVDANTNADVLLAHLRPGSVQVQQGAAVAVGDWLGLAGNSGNTSEPHLHVHAQRPDPVGAPLGGEPLPIKFGGRFAVRGDRIESP